MTLDWTRRDHGLFIISIGLTFIVWSISAALTHSSQNILPTWAPSETAFLMLWGGFYIVAGLSFYFIITEKYIDVRDFITNPSTNVILYEFQLAASIIWAALFFGEESFTISLLFIIVVLISTTYLMGQFRSISKRSFHLIIPYFVWIVLVTIMNIVIL